MKRIIIFLLVTITNIIVSHAQTTICGTVVSDNDDQPIIGASITIDGQNQGALSDMDGKFKITVPAGKKIIVNYIGMKKITCTPQNNMLIRLSSKSSKVTSASKNKSGSLSAEKKYGKECKEFAVGNSTQNSNSYTHQTTPPQNKKIGKTIRNVIGVLAQMTNDYALAQSQTQNNCSPQNYNNTQYYNNGYSQQNVNGYTNAGTVTAFVINTQYGNTTGYKTSINLKVQNGLYYIHVGAQYYLVQRNSLTTYKGYKVSGYLQVAKAGTAWYFF